MQIEMCLYAERNKMAKLKEKECQNCGWNIKGRCENIASPNFWKQVQKNYNCREFETEETKRITLERK